VSLHFWENRLKYTNTHTHTEAEAFFYKWYIKNKTEWARTSYDWGEAIKLLNKTVEIKTG